MTNPVNGSGPLDCDRIADALLDPWLDRELQVREAVLVAWHLESCASCAAERDARLAFRGRLREAASRIPVPAGLRGRILPASDDEDLPPFLF